MYIARTTIITVMGRTILFLLMELFVTVHLQTTDPEPCTADNDLCLDLNLCKALHEPIKNGFKPKTCGFKGQKQIVCCTTEMEEEIDFREGTKEKTSISHIMCLKYLREVCPSFNFNVIGGMAVPAKEFPFMARIGYESDNKRSIDWRCGGSLISKRFVLSAAHCTYVPTLSGKDIKVPKWAKLGELDTSTSSDDAEPQNFKIVELINHPKYDEKLNYNDIALYRLERDVPFNEYIRPICLYQSQNVYRHKNCIGAGWGTTDNGAESKKLLSVDLDIYNMSTCSNIEDRDRLPNGLDESSQICSGAIEGGRDTCTGDSGGPLFLPSVNRQHGRCVLYTQIGITSFGSNICGTRGKAAIYTKISAYRNWIESIIWNNSMKPIWHQ